MRVSLALSVSLPEVSGLVAVQKRVQGWACLPEICKTGTHLRGEWQPKSRRKYTWEEGQGQGAGSGWCFAAIEEATWENEYPPEPSKNGGAGYGEKAGVPGSQ